MNSQFQAILHQRMDRKDFLKHVALGVAFIVGGATVMKFFGVGAEKIKSYGSGYGSSIYGGGDKLTASHKAL